MQTLIEPSSEGAVDHARLQPPLSQPELFAVNHHLQQERATRERLERELADLKIRPASPSADDLQRLDSAIHAANLRFSRRLAEREHGKEAVDRLHEWAAARCDADPAFNARMRASDDPYEAAREEFGLAETPRRPDPLAILAPPPPSIASAPGNGAAGKPFVPIGEGNAYASIFR